MAIDKKLSIQVVGGDKWFREFDRLGKDGTAALNRIAGATRPASAGLRAVNASARALKSVFNQAAGLIGGYIVSTNREFEQLNVSLKTVTRSTTRFGSTLHGELFQISSAFRTGRINVDRYLDRIWELAVTYPELTKNANEFQEHVLPRTPPSAEVGSTEDKYAGADQSVGANTRLPATVGAGNDFSVHQANVEAITLAYAALTLQTESAVQSSIRWHNETLAGLDDTREGFTSVSNKIEEIFEHKLDDARKLDLQNTKDWEDGIKRGLFSVTNASEDMAALTERITGQVFQSIENNMVSLVTTGKISFSSLVDSILADITRMAVRKTITEPLADMFNYLWEVSGRSHKGGTVGSPSQLKNGPAEGGSLVDSLLVGGSLLGLFHKGGIVGSPSQLKRVPANVFDYAPRYHRGGIVGGWLLPDEVPIIARKGELVIPPERIHREVSRNNTSVTVVMNIKTRDADSFRASQSQIASDVARAMERANRNR